VDLDSPPRRIEAFERDAAGDWVALLACGHRQHVRHTPPLVNRDWVLSAEGRDQKVGSSLPCRNCLMGTLPEGAAVYKTTACFDETNIPSGLLRSHRLVPGTWGRIVVAEGTLLYTIEREPELGFILTSALPGVVQPEQPHRVAARGPVRFRVEFLRPPAIP
jgi:tellurite resistance-related uncharacterized protein